jgi:hypothetical protein
MLHYAYISCLVDMKEDEMKTHVAHAGEMKNPHIKEKAVKYTLCFFWYRALWYNYVMFPNKMYAL